MMINCTKTTAGRGFKFRLSKSTICLHLIIIATNCLAARDEEELNLFGGVERSELMFEGLFLRTIPIERMCRNNESQVINAVSVAHNRVKSIDSRAFECVAAALKILTLSHNVIEQISPLAFFELRSLEVLLLDNNLLMDIPSKETLGHLKSLRHLDLANNRIETVFEEAFGSDNANLISLNLKGNPLRTIAPNSLLHLAKLKTLTLSQSALIGQMTSLNGLSELRFYHLDRSKGLQTMPTTLCASSRKLSSLVLKSNQLELVPRLESCENLLLLDLSYNKIRGSLASANFTRHPLLIDLYLAHNQIEFVEADAFEGLSKLQVLQLNNNHLKRIHSFAFVPIRSTIYDLNLAHNAQLRELPALGLDRLISLKAFGNQQLKQLPRFKSARTLALTYAYHCCDYLESADDAKQADLSLVGSILARLRQLVVARTGEVTGNGSGHDKREEDMKEIIIWPPRVAPSPGPDAAHATIPAQDFQRPSHLNLAPDELIEPSASKSSRGLSSDSPAKRRRRNYQIYNGRASLIDELVWQVKQIRVFHKVLGSLNHGGAASGLEADASGAQDIANFVATRLLEELNRPRRQLAGSDSSSSANSSRSVQCLPAPNAFLPCKDLFDAWWLRIGIWCVFSLAFAGNILVIIVLSSMRQSSSTSALTSIMWLTHSKRHIDVPRFLVINLAVADLFMALYLGLLAFVDLSTLGEFKLFAIKWQYSIGCKLAAFLGVLSSELSVFILAVITLERNYAITNAVHLNRRLSLQKAMIIMFVGYIFALLMAVLPLYGISDYRKFSICLPLDMDSNLSAKVYVVSLIGINTFSFLLLISCYLRMYCAIRGSQAWNTNDLRIAKRMSILVLTDFLCWMPIIVASVAALLNHHLIGTQGIKILTIFILPLNSVANPFLYAITTKKFKRDLDILARRIGSHLKCAACCSQTDEDPKMFMGYNQYERNIIMSNKRKHDVGGRNGLEKQQRVLAAYNRNKRPLTKAHQTANQVTVNKTTCSCQQRAAAGSPQTSARPAAFMHVKPKIVLEAAVEPALNVALAPCGLVRKSLSVQVGAGEYLDRERNNSSNVDYLIVKAPPKHQIIQQKSEPLSCNREDCLRECRLLAPSIGICASQNPYSSVYCSTLTDQNALHASCQEIMTDRTPMNYLNVDVAQNDATRSASACGYQSSLKINQSTGHRFCAGSYDLMLRTTTKRSNEKIGRSISRLLFSPIAKAWSSIQISLNSSVVSHIGFRDQTNNQNLNLSQSPEAEKRLQSNLNLEVERDAKLLNESTIDDILLMSPASKLLRTSERRMSRSCDLLPYNVLLVSPTHSTTCQETTTSNGEYDDDKRILLATINRIATGRQANQVQAQENSSKGDQYLRSKCTRCRSWSPALLSKLEDCFNQIKCKIPGLSSVKSEANEELQESSCQVETTCEDVEENQLEFCYGKEGVEVRDLTRLESEDESREIDDYYSEDKFNESDPIDWPEKRRTMVRLNHSRRNNGKLQQQSSTNSDTTSIRTAGTILTNMSVSFDSSANIPDSNNQSAETGSD